MANSTSYLELFLNGFHWENRDKMLDVFPLMNSLMVVICEKTVGVSYFFITSHCFPPLQQVNWWVSSYFSTHYMGHIQVLKLNTINISLTQKLLPILHFPQLITYYNINKLLSGVDSWKKHVWLIKCANATQIILYTLIGSILSYNLLLNGTLGKLIKSLLQIWQSISKNLFWLQAMKMTVMTSIQIHSPWHMSITSTLSWHWSSHYVATAV